MATEFEIKHYKVLELPKVLKPNVVYYLLDTDTKRVKGYITDINGVPIELLEVDGNIVTGTGVTGTLESPKVNISTFVSTQLGNLVHLSTLDGKLQVNPIISPDGSIDVNITSTEIQLKLSDSIVSNINSALQPGDNVSELVNDGDGTSPYITAEQLDIIIGLNGDKNYYHDQAIPSATWSIIHNLGKKPSVSVMDTAGTEVEGEVKHISLNEVKILFSAAFSGNATLN